MSRSKRSVSADKLRTTVANIFHALGVENQAAEVVAEALVEADEEGVASHGVALVPMYVERLRQGSVSKATQGRIVHDRGTSVVIDAENILGQLSSRQALGIAATKAKELGLAAVAVRNAFHFGAAGRYALELACQGLIGVVMSNTRPLMPAPGGAERLVGNNPLAIAMPSNGDGPPPVLDMAMSATAMGNIRLAESAGEQIPEGWATDAQGRPTTDPAQAIKGMLMPAAGPKGFGLAFMIDLLCGGLSAGATGADVRPLYGNPAEPYRCSHFFLAIDVEHFRDVEDFSAVVDSYVQQVRHSAHAPGFDSVMSPGEPAWKFKQESQGDCSLDESVFDNLCSLSASLGIEIDFS